MDGVFSVVAVGRNVNRSLPPTWRGHYCEEALLPLVQELNDAEKGTGGPASFRGEASCVFSVVWE